MREQTKTERHRRKILVLMLTAICLAGLAWFVKTQVSLEVLVRQEIHIRKVIELQPWRSFLIGFGLYTVLSLIPGTGGKAIVYGWLFGFWQAMIIVIFSLTAAALLVFSLSRYLFRQYVERRYTGFLAILNRHIEKDGALYLLTLRMAHAPFSIINPVSGASRVTAWTFIWTTFIGLLPGTLIWVYLGCQLPSLRDLAETGPLSLLDPLLIATLAASALLPLLFHRVILWFGSAGKKQLNMVAGKPRNDRCGK